MTSTPTGATSSPVWTPSGTSRRNVSTRSSSIRIPALAPALVPISVPISVPVPTPVPMAVPRRPGSGSAAGAAGSSRSSRPSTRPSSGSCRWPWTGPSPTSSWPCGWRPRRSRTPVAWTRSVTEAGPGWYSAAVATSPPGWPDWTSGSRFRHSWSPACPSSSRRSRPSSWPGCTPRSPKRSARGAPRPRSGWCPTWPRPGSPTASTCAARPTRWTRPARRP